MKGHIENAIAAGMFLVLAYSVAAFLYTYVFGVGL